MSSSSNPASDSGPASLAALEARLRRDLELLTLPPAKDWLEPRTHPQYPVLDVAIIGAGMAGLAAAFALKCLGVRSLRLFDRAPQGREGPWATNARMETLRSPPELTDASPAPPGRNASACTTPKWAGSPAGPKISSPVVRSQRRSASPSVPREIRAHGYSPWEWPDYIAEWSAFACWRRRDFARGSECPET